MICALLYYGKAPTLLSEHCKHSEIRVADPSFHETCRTRVTKGTRNDEAQFRLGGGSGGVAAQSPLADRLTVHSIRDVDGRILGLGPRQRNAEGWSTFGERDAILYPLSLLSQVWTSVQICSLDEVDV